MVIEKRGGWFEGDVVSASLSQLVNEGLVEQQEAQIL